MNCTSVPTLSMLLHELLGHLAHRGVGNLRRGRRVGASADQLRHVAEALGRHDDVGVGIDDHVQLLSGSRAMNSSCSHMPCCRSCTRMCRAGRSCGSGNAAQPLGVDRVAHAVVLDVDGELGHVGRASRRRPRARAAGWRRRAAPARRRRPAAGRWPGPCRRCADEQIRLPTLRRRPGSARCGRGPAPRANGEGGSWCVSTCASGVSAGSVSKKLIGTLARNSEKPVVPAGTCSSIASAASASSPAWIACAILRWSSSDVGDLRLGLEVLDAVALDQPARVPDLLGQVLVAAAGVDGFVEHGVGQRVLGGAAVGSAASSHWATAASSALAGARRRRGARPAWRTALRARRCIRASRAPC